MSKARFFVTGTDTSVGKTLVSAALLHLAGQKGLRTMGLKPVSAGCETTESGLRNSDALILQEYSSVGLSYDQVNPVALEAPLSPNIAAAYVGKRLVADRLSGFCRGAMMTPHDFCIVEGAGGWRVPISDRETMADIAGQLQLPVILVVGIRLGCLNHALLTLEAVRRDGLAIAGWVASVIDAEAMAVQENIETLQKRIPHPLLGQIPYQYDITVEQAASHIDIGGLIKPR